MVKTLRIAATKIREDMSDTINTVAYSRTRVVLHRHGKDVAAVVPIEDLKLLETIERDEELNSTLNALITARERGTIPWEKIKADLGL